jgi:hypothetical protein
VVLQNRISILGQKAELNLKKKDMNSIQLMRDADAIFVEAHGRLPEISTVVDTRFKKYSRVSPLFANGGDTSLLNFQQWSKTVQENPAIIDLRLRPLLDLLTIERFPQDVLIVQKKDLIERALIKYFDTPVFCYDNCSDHGQCESTRYFQFGLCNCTEKWTGIDCSRPLRSNG